MDSQLMAQFKLTKKRLVNPPRRKKAAARKKVSAKPKRKATKRNAPELIALGFLNPSERKRPMKKKSKGGGKKKAAAPKRRNGSRPLPPTKQKKRRNGARGVTGKAVGFLRMTLVALIAAFATRQVPQWLLGARNTGYVGYAANIATALSAAALAGKFASRQDSVFALVGGAVMTGSRVISEKFGSGPIRQLALSGVGDASALSGARRGVRGIGPAYFASPPVYQNGKPVIPQEILEQAAAYMDAKRASTAAAPPGAALAGLKFGRAA